MGNHIRISGGTVGAVAAGDHASAVGHVAMGAGAWPANQEDHRAAIRETQKALLENQDDIDGRLFDALNQFLRLARDIQIEQKSQAEVQAQMKATLDEVWAREAAKSVTFQALPQGLEIAKQLTTNPVMIEVAKKLLGV